MNDPVLNFYSFAGLDGIEVQENETLGQLSVSHDGTLTWDQLQQIKNEVWGKDARAIEVYPAQSDVVNSGNIRHLWRLSRSDFCPDLLGHQASNVFDDDNLELRHLNAWAEANEVCP